MADLEEIVALYAEMESLTLAAGVPKSQYEEMLRLSESEVVARSDWMHRIRHAEYFGVLEVWRLLSPEVWAGYEAHGFRNLREQKLLRDRRRALRRAWKKWYQENHRGEKEECPKSDADQAAADGLGVQPEGADAPVGGGQHG